MAESSGIARAITSVRAVGAPSSQQAVASASHPVAVISIAGAQVSASADFSAHGAAPVESSAMRLRTS